VTPAQRAISAYHDMRAPRNMTEHITAAALLGLPLDTRDPDGTTLRERIAAYWGKAPAAPSYNPGTLPPLPSRRGPVSLSTPAR
jgi:hypothetical protein